MNIEIPMIVLVALREFPVIVQRGVIQGEPSGLLGLKRWNWQFKVTKSATVHRTKPWKRQSCTKNSWARQEAPLKSLAKYWSALACEKTADLSPGKEPSERISSCSIWQLAKVRIVPVPSAKLKNFTITWHWTGYLERSCLSSAQ